DRAHPAAGKALIRIAGDPARPALVRAAALSFLGGYPSQDALTALARGASDPDPLVRSEAARALVFLRPDDRAGILGPLLRDPILAVRFAAARALAGTSRELLSTEDRRWLDRALGEYEAGMALSLDDPAANVELGLYHLEGGRTREAEAAYRRAIELEPAFAPAYVNLADLYRASGRDDEGLVLLREGVAVAPRAASLRHSLGLLHVRAGRQELARADLARAAELDPEGAPYALAYALALGGEGRADEAVAVIEAALEHHPHDRELLLALTDLRRRAGDLEEAVGTVRRLMELYPDDERFHRLDRRLRDELTLAMKEGSR
ncbi:MAG TPA: tetratricopeptide repeat protein, partial [Longimicrobiales bacterium]|nr:tetratricopeptide repeat protein [Longimicrobiales bacterium]